MGGGAIVSYHRAAMRLHSMCALALLVSCGGDSKVSSNDKPAPPPQQQQQPSAPETNPPTKPAGPKLAESPRVDLIANRHRWHLHGAGLIVAAATPGIWKYTQEYSAPWGPVVDHDGRDGRALRSRAATLRIPADSDGPAVLRVRAHGVAGKQRISVAINGKTLRNADLAAAWTALDIAIPAGALRAGENDVQLSFGKSGTAGGQRAYALVHSLELISGDTPPAADPWPGLAPAAEVTIGGVAHPALTGTPELSMYLEIPRTGWLDVQLGSTADEARFTVRAVDVDGAETAVLDERVAPGAWQRRTVSLEPLGGKLVRLHLRAEGAGAAWGAPAIALADAPVAERPKPVRHAIVFVVDALRSDRLTVYNPGTRVRSPRITAEVEKGGVVYLNNQAASPSSPPSHGSIQTGMIPRVHGVVGDTAKLAAGTPMISTQARDAGISAAYFGNNAFGMGRLEKPGNWTEYHEPNREGRGIDCVPLVDDMLAFADKQVKAGERFFISALPYETHVPYRFHEGVTERYHPGPWDPPIGKQVTGEMLGAITGGGLKMDEQRWAQLKALYDGEVEHMDMCFARLLDGLAKLGIAGDTAVILTSDHGEGMYEHGRMGHAFGHYAELGNVPFVVFAPGLVDKGVVIDTPTSHIDIAPTVLDLLGAPIEEQVQGISVVPLALRRGPWTPRAVPLEYGRSYALKAVRWKYIVDYSGNEELFDHATDPTEQTDARATRPMALRYMRELAGFFLRYRSEWRMRAWGDLANHAFAFADDAVKLDAAKR